MSRLCFLIFFLSLSLSFSEYQSRDPVSTAHGGRVHTPSAMTMLSAQNALEGETMQILSALYTLCDVVVVIPSDISDMRLLKLVAQFLRLRPGVLRGTHEKAIARQVNSFQEGKRKECVVVNFFVDFLFLAGLASFLCAWFRTLFSPVLKLSKDDIFSDARADALEATIEEAAPVALRLAQRVSGLSQSDVEDIIKIGPLVIRTTTKTSGSSRSNSANGTVQSHV